MKIKIVGCRIDSSGVGADSDLELQLQCLDMASGKLVKLWSPQKKLATIV